ncbi:MAG: HD domain-containing protein [Candidatus Micrarchaeota archaeon]|nr:HD domain-containing protein [Candidatus Micrarchaeota archaeon]
MNIRDMHPFEKIEGKFIIKFKKPVQKYARGYAFQLNVADATGSIMLKYWGPDNEAMVNKLYESLSKDDVIFVSGQTTVYNEQMSINVDSNGTIRKLEKNEYDSSEFVRASEKDIEKMKDELEQYLDSIENDELKKLVGLFRQDAEFMNKFGKHPAAMYRHQGWIGGLLEHTLNMIKICDTLSRVHPELDRDLLITGCFVHDIGKLEELDVSASIKVTDEGVMVGHITLGAILLEKKIKEAKISKGMRMKLLNIAISHHGQIEYGSPKLPAFPEALAIAQADAMDSKLAEMIDLKKNAQTDDRFAYSRDMGNVYLD